MMSNGTVLDLSEALLIARRRKGKSQADVAHDLGLHRRTVSDFESGRSAPHYSTLRMFRVWLLWNGGEEQSPTEPTEPTEPQP